MKKIFSFIMVAFAFLLLSSNAVLAEVKLLMFEKEGCYWCQKWKEEVGVVYDKSPEGKIAKLEIIMMSEGLPEQYELNSTIIYSPTFVLVEDNMEIGRIEGYPGEDFFWGLLEKLIAKLENKA